jgi:hypothetical protein
VTARPLPVGPDQNTKFLRHSIASCRFLNPDYWIPLLIPTRRLLVTDR